MRSLLLLPLLGPLLAIVLVAALNPRPQVSLRLLVWSTPSLPLGAWMALAAAGGTALSGGAAALALGRPERRRQSDNDARDPIGERGAGDWRRADEPAATPRSAAAKPPPASAAAASPGRSRDAGPAATAAGPARAPGEPPPTVAVPYRVIQRPAHAAAAPAASAAAATSTAAATAAATSATAAGDWDSAPEEDW